MSLHAIGFRSNGSYRSLLGISETEEERRQLRSTVTGVTRFLRSESCSARQKLLNIQMKASLGRENPTQHRGQGLYIPSEPAAGRNCCVPGKSEKTLRPSWGRKYPAEFVSGRVVATRYQSKLTVCLRLVHWPRNGLRGDHPHASSKPTSREFGHPNPRHARFSSS